MFFLGKTAIGLDVDDLSLELVELQQTITGAKIVSTSHMILPAGLIANGIIVDEFRLASAIKQLFDGAEPKKIKVGNVIFGLPHSQFYPALVEIPASDTKKTIEDIWQAAYTNLPFEADDLMLEYKILEKTDSFSRVLLIGVSKKYVASWQKMLGDLGLTIDIFDISSYALWRDLVVDKSTGAVAVVDMGANKNNIFIFNKGQLNYSYDFDEGGNNLTEILISKFKLNKELAEDKKIKLGLNRQVFPVLEHTLKEWSKEISLAIHDYESKTDSQVVEIKLVGGGANLKGLVNYYQEKFKIPVSLGGFKSLKTSFDGLYFEACGLALRGLDIDKYKNEPFLSLIENKEKFNMKAISHNNSEIELLDPSQESSILSSRKQVDDESDDEIDLEMVSVNKYNSEKKLLAAILLVGILILGVVYWYRSSIKAKSLANSSPAVAFSEVQSFPYKIIISLDESTYESGMAKGRLVNDTVATGSDFNEILNISRRQVSGKLSAEEELWPEPLNEIIDKTNITYPVTFRWLVVNRKEILNLALSEVERQNINKVPYEFNAITKTKIEKTESVDKIYLYGEISVSLNTKIAVAQIVDLSLLASVGSTSTISTTSTELPATTTAVVGTSSTNDPSQISDVVGTQQLKIGPTETGWLNVRLGPGKNFEILAKIYPDETYEYVKKEGDWIQIVLKDGRQGWILAKYAILSI